MPLQNLRREGLWVLQPERARQLARLVPAATGHRELNRRQARSIMAVPSLAWSASCLGFIPHFS